jgi:predicted phosphate transport protein (TIGR00153 family)
MFKKKDNNYFDMFVNLVNYSCIASEKLCQVLESFDTGKLSQMMEDMHAIEHKADLEKHDMMKKLAKEFITPIEREDIISLSHEIDDVTDCIEEVLIKIYMFNLKELPEGTSEFTKVISKSCKTLKEAMEEFHNFRKSSKIHKLIIDVNGLEEECDRLYTKAIRNLFENCSDPVKLMAHTEIYECFESCCDACEDVSEGIESVIMKNS